MDNLINKLGDLPEVLNHYTDAGALLGILQKNEFWASYIRFMNDYTEFTLAKEKLLQKLPTFIKQNILDSEDVVNRIKINFESMIKRIDLFVISFSEKENDLDQWRAYGKSTPNYSLKINSKKFCNDAQIIYEKDKIIENIDAYVYSKGAPAISRIILPCIYEESEQESLIDEILNDSFKFFKKNGDEIKFADTLARRFVYYSPMIKNKTYENEKEWRVIILFNEHEVKIGEEKNRQENEVEGKLELESKIEKIDFRSNGSYFIPYYKMKFSTKDFIEKIYVGACPDFDTVKESVEYLVRKTGFNYSQINGADFVTKSKLAYRNW